MSQGPSGGTTGRPPDVFLVVTDTTRRDVLSGGARPAGGQADLDALRADCWVHPKAISAAPWTAPSHASLFTGRPLWEHHLHLRGERRLPSGISTLAESLAQFGYRTACFAANDYIGPVTGLQRGFQEWCSGGKQDWLLRGFHGPPTRGSDLQWRAQLRRTAHPARLIYYGLHEPVWTYASRWPTLPGKFGELLAPHDQGLEGRSVAGWIDDELSRWLATVPPETPVFVFLNYMESHEPYLGLKENGEAADSRRGGLAPTRQDARGWASGAWVPSEGQLSNLRRLYLSHVPRAEPEDPGPRGGSPERRAVGPVALRAHERPRPSPGRRRGTPPRAADRRAAGTGPAVGPAPPGVTVPLPKNDWVSLASVRGALEEIVHAVAEGRSTAVVEGGDDAGSLREPVVTIADGVGGLIRPFMSKARLELLDRLTITAYKGPHKLSLDVASGRCTLTDFDRDPSAEHPREVTPSGELEELHRVLRYAAGRTFEGSIDPGAKVDSRLESWGY